jgi:hypothetical protein
MANTGDARALDVSEFAQVFCFETYAEGGFELGNLLIVVA